MSGEVSFLKYTKGRFLNALKTESAVFNENVLLGFLVMVGHALELAREGWWRHARLMPYTEAVGRWLEVVSGHRYDIQHRFELPALPVLPEEH